MWWHTAGYICISLGVNGIQQFCTCFIIWLLYAVPMHDFWLFYYGVVGSFLFVAIPYIFPVLIFYWMDVLQSSSPMLCSSFTMFVVTLEKILNFNLSIFFFMVSVFKKSFPTLRSWKYFILTSKFLLYCFSHLTCYTSENYFYAWFKIRDCHFLFSPHNYPAVPASLIEKTVLPPLPWPVCHEPSVHSC